MIYLLRMMNQFFLANGSFGSCASDLALGFLTQDDAWDAAVALGISREDVQVVRFQREPERAKFAIQNSAGWLSTDGEWIAILPGHRIRRFDTAEEATAAVPSEADAHVRSLFWQKDGVGPCTLMVDDLFIDQAHTPTTRLERRVIHANAQEARVELEKVEPEWKNKVAIVYLDRAKNMMLLHELREWQRLHQQSAYVHKPFVPPADPAPADADQATDPG